jgi:hypothetical protein
MILQIGPPFFASPYFKLLAVVGMTGVYHQVQLISVEVGSGKCFGLELKSF